MAISEEKKIDLLWKKVGYGVAKTDDTDRKSASNESIPSPLLIRGDSIWLESNKIPDVLPQTSSNVLEVKSDYVSTTVECVMDITSTPLRTWKSNQIDWIPVEFGPTYQVKVYVDVPNAADPQTTGTRLYPDGVDSDEWFFDYSAGVLHFIGDSLPASLDTTKSVYISGARYVGQKGLQDLDLSNTGSTSAVQGDLPASQTFTSNGISMTYQLSHTPASQEAIDVYVNDVLQRPGEVYSLQNSTLVFTVLPPSGTDIYVKYRYPFATIFDLPDNSIKNEHLHLEYTSDQYNGDDTQTIYDINPGHTVHDVLVIVNGSILPPQAYNISGTVLTLNNPPKLGEIVDIRYLPV
jgi:hypothetical protein